MTKDELEFYRNGIKKLENQFKFNMLERKRKSVLFKKMLAYYLFKELGLKKIEVTEIMRMHHSSVLYLIEIFISEYFDIKYKDVVQTYNNVKKDFDNAFRA